MAITNFTAGLWDTPEMRAALARNQAIWQEIRRLKRLERYDEIPPDPAEVAAHAAFAARWDALVAEGVELGLVDGVYDYDTREYRIGWELTEPPAPTRELAWTEPDDEYQARTGIDPNEPVTIRAV